ncbi:agamous-like MADS-box protein AGL80 [Quillaja saponaria]|uniref:Agamous-like MADS-box protein AGL80 n=1 Tax=Quillaja saponaria TaxID=32244 RepID=A0AAD7PBP3_QUISA|nr:agamous-like MADS-box protein AGL80 [Quillaja saponaria]
MGNKVKLEFISSESARRVTFKKRKAGVLKKISELMTLCGINACAVIYSGSDAQPEVWPSPEEAFRVIEKFKDLPAAQQGKNMMDQKLFLMNAINKLNKKLGREQDKAQRLERELLLFDWLHGNNFYCLKTLMEVIHVLDEKIAMNEELCMKAFHKITLDEVVNG